MVAGGGKNLPLAILRCLTDWLSVLDARATMNANANAGLYTYLSGFEDNLSTLERILTTPLPFVYSAHIRHTVWIYLFFLPFQLIDQFGWTTIPGVTIAAFIYLGFIAAGEEIEQPFGYDENDLDLDLFCQEIVHKDIDGLKGTPCLNAYIPHHGKGPSHRSIVETSAKVPKEREEQDVFGTLS
jgi:predicted membrane chloride channel (bestrophin family)